MKGRPGSVPVVGIDGPNGVGKTAVARELARRLGWRWVSVGALYRALAAADAAPGARLRLLAAPAADGAIDPVVEVDGVRFAEPDLTGEGLGGRAAGFGRDPAWQRLVNAALREYTGTGLVAEGRATQEIFPDAWLWAYLWADPVERARRAAAVTGAAFDPGRERQDAGRASEPLRVRAGAVVWDSTRYPMDQTVDGLFRRVSLIAGVGPVVVAVAGCSAEGVRGEGLERVRIVDPAAADEPFDVAVVLPPGTPAAQRATAVRAHLRVLLAGNDLVSVGAVRTRAAPATTQRELEAAGWPVNRTLGAHWLLRHAHFAVGADVLALAGIRPAGLARWCDPAAAATAERAGSAATTGGSAGAAAVPAELAAALQGARWVPNPWASAGPEAPAAAGDGTGTATAPAGTRLVAPPPVAPPPVAPPPVAPPLVAPPVAAADASAILAALQSPGAADQCGALDLRHCTDPRIVLWALAAAPGRDLQVALPWDAGGQAPPACVSAERSR